MASGSSNELDSSEENSETPGEATSITIRENPETVILGAGNVAAFTFKAEGPSDPEILWYQGGVFIRPSDRRQVINNGENHTLKIKHVNFADQGLYACICRNRTSATLVMASLYVAPDFRNSSGVIYVWPPKMRDPIIKHHLRQVRTVLGNRIALRVICNQSISEFRWYRDEDMILPSPKKLIRSTPTSSTLCIPKATLTDTGIYTVILLTTNAVLSSSTEVLVSSMWFVDQNTPRIEELLPGEMEVFSDEEVRLVCVTNIDMDDKIQWLRDTEKLEGNNFQCNDYGWGALGITILNTRVEDSSHYRVLLTSERKRFASASTSILNITSNPFPDPPVVSVIQPLKSVIAAPGARVYLECSFDIKDPKYHFFRWYVGRHQVIRSNENFILSSNAKSTSILYIPSVHPNMSGEIVCELRRGVPHSHSVCIQKSWSLLTVVPRRLINSEFRNETFFPIACFKCEAAVVNLKDSYGQECLKQWFLDSQRSTNKPFSLTITFCRFEDGTHYLHTSVRKTVVENFVKVFVQGNNPSSGLKFHWKPFAVLNSWFLVEMETSNNEYQCLGVTSKPFVILTGVHYRKLVKIRVSLVEPERSSYITCLSVALPPEDHPIPRGVLEIKTMESYYQKYTETGEIIGQGAFGSVMLVQDRDGQYFAAKKLKIKTEKNRDTALREYSVMANIKHQKLVMLFDAYEAKGTFVLVMEYLWGGELFDRIAEEDTTEGEVVDYIKQICEALRYLHSKNIAHLDLKPENIVCLSPNSLKIKIIDFGLAREITNKPLRMSYGTPDYIAPEILNNDITTVSCDMWSLGVITYTMLSGLMPFAGENFQINTYFITTGEYDFDDISFDEVSEDAKVFISQLLLVRPGDRMTAIQALEHVWLVEGRLRRTQVMKITKSNMKTYLTKYRSRWQKAGNLLIAARRFCQPVYPLPRAIPAETESEEACASCLPDSLNS